MIPVLGEFGRTPKINPAGGRDHWPQVWTVWFAGGGIKGGRVVGTSDDIGGYPADRPVTTAEIVATIYRAWESTWNTTFPARSAAPSPSSISVSVKSVSCFEYDESLPLGLKVLCRPSGALVAICPQPVACATG